MTQPKAKTSPMTPRMSSNDTAAAEGEPPPLLAVVDLETGEVVANF